jgi:branched-chain amino acid transport system permease protein
MSSGIVSPVLIQLILAGFAMGAVYALVALGYTLIWNAVGVVNFAQGELVMLGAFVAVGTFANVLHLPLALNLLGTLAAMAVFGVLVATFVYRPVRNAPQLSAIVATLGLSMLLQNVVVLIWGPEPLSFQGPLGTQTVTILGAKIYAQYVLILLTLLLLMAAQEGMFRFTSIGRAMRATAQDAEAARLMGIRTNRIVALIFAYASMLAGLAGWLLSPLFYVSADMGGKVSLDAFAACILGGFGSIPGALIGGLLLGLIESLGSFYISSEYIDVIAFGILFAMLVVRPEGIFGEPQLERP